MSITVETNVSIGHARRRDDAGSDQDRIPEHLKCVACLGKGKLHGVLQHPWKTVLVVPNSVALNP